MGAVNAYRPFLIPFLKECPAPDNPPDCPLSEEHVIASLGGGSQFRWECLQSAIRKQYGLPLILEWEGTCQRPDFCSQSSLPDQTRVLLLKSEGASWFLLEHPDALPLYDQFAGYSQAPAIGKPSLFIRLWRESELAASPGVIEEEAPSKGRESSQQALCKHIADLVHDGNPSDWHLEPCPEGFRSRLRINGRLTAFMQLSSGKGNWLQNALCTRAGIRDSEGSRPVEGRTQFPGPPAVTVRLSLVPALYGRAMVARFHYKDQSSRRDLKALGLPVETGDWIDAQYTQSEGLWLVVGPTGSGKTTTLHALLKKSVSLNEKVLTVEDPVEELMAGTQQVDLDVSRGLTYSCALRAFLRQAPDTILVGEIRDEDTASVAIQASRSGHRVLSTLHARNDTGLLRRFEDLGQDSRSVTQVVRMVLHQRLLPRLCLHCRQQEPLGSHWRQRLARLGFEPPEHHFLPVGCAQCHSGYTGRIAAFSSGRFLDALPVERQLGTSIWNSVLNGTLSLGDCGFLVQQPADGGFQLCQA